MFKDAFKTGDFKELGEILKKNPDEFFTKFADALGKSKQAQAGFNIAVEKGKDAILGIAREVGQPFLEPLTNEVQVFTRTLNENKDTFHDWAVTAADSVSGVIQILEKLKGTKGSTTISVLGTALRVGAAGATYGVSEGVIGTFKGLAAIGEAKRKKAETEKNLADLKYTQENGLRSQRAVTDSSGNVSFFDKTDDEIKSDVESAERKASEARENLDRIEAKHQDERLKIIEKRRDVDLAYIQSRADYGKALLNLQTGKLNPVEIIRHQAALEEVALQSQIARRDYAAKEATKNLSTKDLADGKALIISQDNANDVGKLNDQIQIVRLNAKKAETDEIKRQSEAVRTLRNETKDFLLSATDTARDNNPFLKIFSEGESAVERFEQRFKQFGVEFARQMAQIELRRLQGEAAQVRYQSSSRALGFQQEARRLELLPERKTTDFKNAVERVQLQVSGYTEIFKLQKEIRDLEGTTVAADVSRLGNFQADIQRSRSIEDFQTELKELKKDKSPEGRKKLFRRQQDFDIYNRENALKKQGDQENVRDALEQAKFLSGIALEGTGIYGSQIIAKEIASVLNPVKDVQTDSSSALAINRGLRGANSSLIAGKRQEILDKIADQQFVEVERREALEKLKNLQGATGLTARQRNAEFLNITSELGNENLTPALRKARIEFLNEASRLEKQNEKEMLDAVKAVAKAMGKIDKIVTEKGLNVNLSEVPLLDLTVSDKLSVNTENGLPSTPNPGDTAREMGKDNYRWVDNRTEKK